jgi:flagellar biosynthesis/type III secretory pathway protein FliH
MSKASEKLAQEILALVDEFPSEPFSFERRQIADKIEQMVLRHTQETEESLDEGFNVGVEEGRSQMLEELQEVHSSEIEELKEKYEEDQQRAYDLAFQEGYEVARLEYDNS